MAGTDLKAERKDLYLAARMFELSQAASDSARFRPAVWAEGGCVEFDKA